MSHQHRNLHLTHCGLQTWLPRTTTPTYTLSLSCSQSPEFWSFSLSHTHTPVHDYSHRLFKDFTHIHTLQSKHSVWLCAWFYQAVFLAIAVLVFDIVLVPIFCPCIAVCWSPEFLPEFFLWFCITVLESSALCVNKDSTCMYIHLQPVT